MANPRLVVCGPARSSVRPKEWKAVEPLTLRIGSGRHDVHVRINQLSHEVCDRQPPAAVDLVELASYVFAADQLTPRGGPREVEYGEKFRRHFRFEVPVREPSLWQQAEIKQGLTDTLSFLTDDDYEFHFTRLHHPPPLQTYLYGQDCTDDHSIEEVMLFSGGIDSLAGAVQEILVGQRKVALVSHRPVSKLYARQCKVIQAIDGHVAVPRHRPLHVAVEANKGPASSDYTQRSRSFVFAALAAVVARAFALDRIRFYENGVVSLNFPLGPQVLGGRASRTTHPQVLHGFGQLFARLFDTSFRVENPFLWKTKTDVVAGIRAAGYGPLIARTSSCVHTQQQSKQHAHCGRCSQCIDRRLATVAARLDPSDDPAGGYASDVFRDPRSGTDLTLVESYFRMAQKVEQLGDVGDFLAEYAESARVLRYCNMPSDEAARKVHELYRRHSSQVLEVMSEVVAHERAAIVRHAYPPNCLLSIACGRRGDPTARPTATPTPAGANGTTVAGLVVNVDTFTISHEGVSCFLGNTNEFRLIRRLHQRIGTYVSVGDLAEDVWGDDQTTKGAIQTTVCNLRRRLREHALAGIMIDGSQKGHYGLVVAEPAPPTTSDPIRDQSHLSKLSEN